MSCTKPQPKGWYCTRAEGHPGACALEQKPSKWRVWWDRLGRALFT